MECYTKISNLDEDLRYEVMTLAHNLGMKSGFVHMSIAERESWIKRNLRKPSEWILMINMDWWWCDVLSKFFCITFTNMLWFLGLLIFVIFYEFYFYLFNLGVIMVFSSIIIDSFYFFDKLINIHKNLTP